MTRATITNKQTGLKLEGEYNHIDTVHSFAFNIDGTSVTNTMATADWEIEEEKPKRFAEVIAFLNDSQRGKVYRDWTEELRKRKTGGGKPLKGLELYTQGWVDCYNLILRTLENAE